MVTRRTRTRKTPSGISKKNLRLLEGYALVALITIIGGAFGLSWLQKSILLSGQQAAVIAAVLVDLANDDREHNGRSSLKVSPQLQAAAQSKANDMAARSYFSHTTPEGHDSWYWFKQAGYSFTHAGENLAVDFFDSIDVERAWMNSPTHRANIIDSRYTEIGIAIAKGTFEGHDTVFVVQMFGTPPPAKPGAEQAPIQTSSIPADPRQMATAQAVRAPERQVLGENIKPLEEVAIAAPTPQQSTKPNEAQDVSFMSRLRASPHAMLGTVYYALALFVLFALLLTTRFEFKRHHVRHYTVASTLIVVIWGLFVIAGTLIFPEPLIAMHPQANTPQVSHQ